MFDRSTLIKGTFFLTFAGFLTRIMGFFYRIFLSRVFTSEEIGFYQLIFPIYALAFSFSTSGIQTAVARSTARYYAQNKKAKAALLLKSALALTICLSFFSMIFIQKNATFLSETMLCTPETKSLLFLITYALPFAAIHNCVNGYFLGQKNYHISAYSQLLEQIFRMCSVYLFFYVTITHHATPSILIAVGGIIVGEISACLYSIAHCQDIFVFRPSAKREYLSITTQLMKLSFPLTASRVLLNIMQSVESIAIPLRLQVHGLDSSSALSLYGIFSGMALPCILFPSAITNALSSMLLPAVAEFQVSKTKSQLKGISYKVAVLCFLMGCGCFLIFFIFGSFMGNLIFNNEEAGSFIVTLSFMCPFLYMNTTLITILNGLGDTSHSFVINIFSLLIRILSVFIGIPHFGFSGYLIGLFTSQLITSVLSFLRLHKRFSKE